jgi:class 3 adenylate cyclase
MVPLGIKVRAGLHTGEVERTQTDVLGIAVHIAARVMDTANAGEVIANREGSRRRLRTLNSTTPVSTP